MNRMKEQNIAVIFAGGTGSRMGYPNVPKQFLKLDGKPIIVYTLELFQSHPMIDAIVVVCIASWMDYLKGMLAAYKLDKVKVVVEGGDCTQSSIYKGLCAAEQFASSDSVVLVHDGVRPLITEKTITDNIKMVRESGTCITCAPPTETILVDDSQGGYNVPRRSNMLVARAPQSFRLGELLELHNRAIKENKLDFIDCCEMARYYGKNIATVMGPAENIKITTPADFFVFEAFVRMLEKQLVLGV